MPGHSGVVRAADADLADAYSRQLEERFDQAAEAVGGLGSLDLEMAGLRLRLRYAGELPRTTSLAPFEHLSAAAGSEPELSISLFGTASTGVEPPPPLSRTLAGMEIVAGDYVLLEPDALAAHAIVTSTLSLSQPTYIGGGNGLGEARPVVRAISVGATVEMVAAPRPGIGAARNAAVAVARGDFVAFLLRARELGLGQEMLAETVTPRRIHGANRSIHDRDERAEFARHLKRSLDRRRGAVP